MSNSESSPLSNENLAAHDESSGGPSSENRTREEPMPDLRTESNSSAASSESPSAPRVVRVDGNINLRDEEADQVPPVGSRRPRADNDSGDADRDRRPPAQRSNSSGARGTGANNSNPPRASGNPNLDPRIHPNSPNTFWRNGPWAPAAPIITPGFGGGQWQGGQLHLADLGGLTGGGFAGPTLGLNDFLNMFGGALGGLSQPERADPERARLMVRALEPVPEGLVQRLQRLQELGKAGEGDCICAICWEGLLMEGGGFTDGAAPEASGNAMEGVEAPTAGSASTQATDQQDADLPKIVTLPCTHTFHTACLIPWFSRPQGTTCPTCRFELDPDGDLTGRRAPQRAATAGGPAPFGMGGHAHAHAHTGQVNFNMQGALNGMNLGPFSLNGLSLGTMPAGGAARPQPAPRQGSNLRRSNSTHNSSRSSGIRGLAQQVDASASNARSTSRSSSTNPSGSRTTPQTRSTDPSARPARPFPRPHAPSSGTSGNNSRSGSRTPSNSNPFNPATLGLSGTGTPGLGGLAGTLLNSFFGNLPGLATGSPAGRSRGTGTGPTGRSGHQDDDLPPLEPINASTTSSSRAPPSTNDDDMEVDVALEGIFDDGGDMPWMPTQRPSQEMQDELLREMARSYASRMAELVFMEQRQQQISPFGLPAPFPQPLGAHGAHPHLAIPATYNLGNGIFNTGMPTGVLGDGVLVGEEGSGDADEEIAGVDFVFHGVDQDGNEVGHMHLRYDAATGEPRLVTPNAPAQDQPPSPNPQPPQQPTPAAQPNPPSPNATPNQPENTDNNPNVPVDNIAQQLTSAITGMFRNIGIPVDAVAINGIQQMPGAQAGNAQTRQQQFTTTGGGLGGGTGGARRPSNANARRQSGTAGQPQQTAEEQRRERQSHWVPPAPTGPSIREKVEQKERETGLRCWEASCGVGPSDEEPVPSTDVRDTVQIRLRKKATTPSSSAYSDSGSSDKGKQKETAVEDSIPEYACEHSFHPGCLASATRVALSVRGGAVEPDRIESTGDVELTCPVCRTSGIILAREWDEGVHALD